MVWRHVLTPGVFARRRARFKLPAQTADSPLLLHVVFRGLHHGGPQDTYLYYLRIISPFLGLFAPTQAEPSALAQGSGRTPLAAQPQAPANCCRCTPPCSLSRETIPKAANGLRQSPSGCCGCFRLSYEALHILGVLKVNKCANQEINVQAVLIGLQRHGG